MRHSTPAKDPCATREMPGTTTPLSVLLLLLAGTAAAADVGIGGEPIRVEYYMEALCPYCANFTLTQLQPMFESKLINFVHLDIIAYGNARTDPNTGAVTCQHGAVECQLNKLLSCGIALNPVVDDWFPFVACIEEAGLKGIKAEEVDKVAHGCAVHAGLVPSKLMDCYGGQLGDSLQRLAAQRTASLKPAHQWVPWVVVNGIPLLDDDENIMRYICVAYRGRDRPKVCLEEAQPSSAAVVTSTAPQQRPQQKCQRCKLGQAHQQAQQQKSAAGQAATS